jgi:hypothetical protein
MSGIKERESRTVEISRELDNLAHLLDGAFKVPFVGWRFGFDFILGLIPAVGDFATSLVSFYILIAGVRYRVPKITLVRMGMNILIDYLVGLVPIVGDIIDIFWRANEKNIFLIKERASPDRGGTASDYFFVGGIVFVLASVLLGTIAMSAWLIYLLVDLLLDFMK